MSRFIASINALIIFLSALMGFHTTETKGGFTNKDWMSGIDDEAVINTISIPGSHDTCAFYEPIDNSAKCQEYTVADQLDMGVRFLDLRCLVTGNRISMSHGLALQGQYLDEILDDCISFLKENPTETIIVSLREETQIKPLEKIFVSMLEGLIEKDKNMWYTQNALPKLGEVRGKMILLNRFSKKSSLGLQAANWKDNTAFVIFCGTYGIHIQDYYNIGKSTDKKWTYIKRHFLYAQDNRSSYSNTLYINFISSYKTNNLLSDIKGTAQELNEKTAAYLDGQDNVCTGIVLFDFVTQELCDKVIRTNY